MPLWIESQAPVESTIGINLNYPVEVNVPGVGPIPGQGSVGVTVTQGENKPGKPFSGALTAYFIATLLDNDLCECKFKMGFNKPLFPPSPASNKTELITIFPLPNLGSVTVSVNMTQQEGKPPFAGVNFGYEFYK